MTQALPPILERRNRAFKVAAFIVLVGPIAGVVPLVVFVLPQLALEGTLLTAENLEGVAVLFLWFVMFAYIFAGLSCLMAAAWLGRMTYTNGTFGWLAALGAAGVSTLVGGLVLGYLASPENGRNIGLVVFMLPLSLFSALVCRYLMIRIGILPPAAATSLAKH